MSKFSSDLFFQACGGTQPLRIVVEDQQNKSYSVFLFEKPNILVGYHESADIRLRSPAVSKRQLYLQLLDGRLFGHGLSTQIPTRWRDEKKTSGWISPSDCLCFGPYRLKVINGIPAVQGENETLENPIVSTTCQIPPLRLVHRVDSPGRFRASVNRTLSLLGGSELCKFRIRNDSVSGIHCSLVRTPSGFWVVDLCGRDGIRLNGCSTRIGRLESGDELELGGIEFHIDYKSALPSIAAPKNTSSVTNSQVTDHQELTVLPQMQPREPGITREEETIERLIGPIVEQFAALQTQTFQHFEQLMRGVIQMFGSMFEKQQDFIREEMKRFDNVTQELGRLQQVLKALPAPPPFAEELLSDLEKSGGSRSQEWASLQRHLSALPAPPPFAEVLPPPFADVLPPDAPKPVAPNPETRTDPNSPIADGKMHLWLQARIAELQTQQTSLWSKLTKIIWGK